jgi:hypothetical protein
MALLYRLLFLVPSGSRGTARLRLALRPSVASGACVTLAKQFDLSEICMCTALKRRRTPPQKKKRKKRRRTHAWKLEDRERVKYTIHHRTCTPYSPWSSYLGIRKLRSPNTYYRFIGGHWSTYNPVFADVACYGAHLSAPHPFAETIF